jgi:hypothetical protein
MTEVIVLRWVETEGKTHRPNQVGVLVGPDGPELDSHQASGVAAAAFLAFWTSVLNPAAEVVKASTAPALC